MFDLPYPVTHLHRLSCFPFVLTFDILKFGDTEVVEDPANLMGAESVVELHDGKLSFGGSRLR